MKTTETNQSKGNNASAELILETLQRRCNIEKKNRTEIVVTTKSGSRPLEQFGPRRIAGLGRWAERVDTASFQQNVKCHIKGDCCSSGALRLQRRRSHWVHKFLIPGTVVREIVVGLDLVPVGYGNITLLQGHQRLTLRVILKSASDGNMVRL